MPAVHPGVDVALDGNELRLLPLGVNRRRPGGLGPVPLGIQLREWVDVVRVWIVVVDVERLVRLQHQHVGDVLAALLIEPDRFRGRGGPLIAGRDVHQHPAQRVPRARHDVFVSTGAPACWVTQLGSFAMSIGFIFGGVPVYVTLPLMVPAAPGGRGGAAPTMLADRASPPVMRTVARTAMECVRISSLLPS